MYNFSRSNILSFTHTTKNYNNVLRTTLLCLQQFNEFGASYIRQSPLDQFPEARLNYFQSNFKHQKESTIYTLPLQNMFDDLLYFWL